MFPTLLVQIRIPCFNNKTETSEFAIDKLQTKVITNSLPPKPSDIAYVMWQRFFCFPLFHVNVNAYMNYRNNNSMSFYQASPSGGGSGSGGGDGGGGDHHAHHHNHHQQLNGYQQQPQQQQPQQQQTTASYSSVHGAQVALEMMPTNSGPGGGGVSNHHPHHHPLYPHHPHPHHQQRAMSLDQGASAYMSPAQQHQLVTPNVSASKFLMMIIKWLIR